MKNLLFIRQTIEAYRLAFVFVSGGFTVVLIPVAFEALQHLIEFSVGMFDSTDGLQGGRENIVRLASGFAKVLSLLLVLVIVTRYFLHDREIRQALSFSTRAGWAFVWLITILVTVFLLVLYIGPLLVERAVSVGISIPDDLQPFLPLLVLMAVMWPLQKYALQLLGALLDDAHSELNDARIVKVWSRQSMPVLLLAFGPVMFLHYRLNLDAIDQPVAMQILMLAADSLLVGLMAVLLGTATWVNYSDAKAQTQSC